MNRFMNRRPRCQADIYMQLYASMQSLDAQRMLSPLHTDPKLSVLRRPALKNLLAQHLHGEPWAAAIDGDPAILPPEVTAACVVSYVTRRDATWNSQSLTQLQMNLATLITRDLHRFASDEWPFLIALNRLLQVCDWSALEPHFAAYRVAWEDAHRQLSSAARLS